MACLSEYPLPGFVGMRAPFQPKDLCTPSSDDAKRGIDHDLSLNMHVVKRTTSRRSRALPTRSFGDRALR